MHYNVLVVFYSQFSHQCVWNTNVAIFRVMLLKEYKGTNVVSCVAVTQQQLRIIISVKIMYVI
jgi:hypothetical protein